MWRFIKDFFIYGFASVLGKIAAVFLMPIYTSILTKEEYGVMALIAACKGIIDLFSNLNIHSGIARDYCEPDIDRKKLVSTGFWSILAISWLVFVILYTTRTFWTNHVLGLGNQYMLAFVVMLLSIPAASVTTYFSVITRFKRKSINYSIGILIQMFIQIGISIYTVIFLRIGVVGLFYGFLAGDLAGAVYFYLSNKNEVALTFESRYLRNALIFSIPTLPAILAGWSDSSFGQILVGKFISESQLGIYSVALQLASVFTLVGIGLNNVWSPYLYENYKKDTFATEVNKLYKMILLLLIFISINISLLSDQIIVLLSNVTYIGAAKYLVLLCIPMSVYLLFPIANSGIGLSRDTKYTALAYVVGGIVNIIILFIFLPRLGVVGVPIALALSRITTFYLLYHVSKKKGFITLNNQLLYILIISVIACFILLEIQIDSIYRICILMIVNTGLIWFAVRQVSVLRRIKWLFFNRC